ncbi:MAG: tRNA 2-thiouridine(34) synthase MnmA [Planctomycetes bacterium]|nr:tRNA 2-thiouridine(34) synthase MnmA [Planctomycetota bacterium]
MARVLCALSGGVDSSVAAYLLQEQGHEVVGVFMRNGVSEASSAQARSCCSASDARDASRVAAHLGIAFYAVDYAAEFRGLIDRFEQDYRAGRTPSPCVLCNQDIKFGHLLEMGDAMQAELVATGHYARVLHDQEGGRLLRAADASKDQSYFLFGIARSVLPRLRFPLGDLDKDTVRALAAQQGLPTADKAESMEICFVPTGDYRDLLRESAPLTPGRFVDAGGNDLGAHDGFESYTVGQRRGLPALGSKHYVVDIDPSRAEVVLGTRDALRVESTHLGGLSWLIDPPIGAGGLSARVQIRAHHEAAPAHLEADGDDGARVSFDEPQEAATPGQAAAVYDAATGQHLLGGGWIERCV